LTSARVADKCLFWCVTSLADLCIAKPVWLGWLLTTDVKPSPSGLSTDACAVVAVANPDAAAIAAAMIQARIFMVTPPSGWVTCF
jgi:hypothetical protein